MSISETQKLKSGLVAWIEQLSDMNMLSVLEGLRDSQSKDERWAGLSKAQIQQINEGLDDVENDRMISSNDFWNVLKNS